MTPLRLVEEETNDDAVVEELRRMNLLLAKLRLHAHRLEHTIEAVESQNQERMTATG